MDKQGLKQKVVRHFPDEIAEEFDFPFFRVFHRSQVLGSRKIGGISNHKLDNVTIYTLEHDIQGDRPRIPINIVADGVHEFIHNFYDQKRYNVKEFKDKSAELNKSYDVRREVVSESDLSAEELLTYSNSWFNYPGEFTFKPATKGLERSVALTLKQDEAIDIFSKLDQDFVESNENQSELEKQFHDEINYLLKSVDKSKIKDYLAPIRQMEDLIELDENQGKRIEDEAMARFYVSTTLPEYAQARFENARTNIKADIGELNHENSDFSRHYTKVLSQEYGLECASAFYKNTEKYRDLIDEGYEPREAADKILIDFLNDVETINL